MKISINYNGSPFQAFCKSSFEALKVLALILHILAAYVLVPVKWLFKFCGWFFNIKIDNVETGPIYVSSNRKLNKWLRVLTPYYSIGFKKFSIAI